MFEFTMFAQTGEKCPMALNSLKRDYGGIPMHGPCQMRAREAGFLIHRNRTKTAKPLAAAPLHHPHLRPSPIEGGGDMKKIKWA